MAAAVAMAQVAKGSAIDLKVAGCGPVGCRFSFPLRSSPSVVLTLAFQITLAF